jgi:hypothetical protein
MFAEGDPQPMECFGPLFFPFLIGCLGDNARDENPEEPRGDGL